MPSPLKISIIQPDIIWRETDQNLRRYSEFLNQTDPGTNLTLLPEMFSTGFTMDFKGIEEHSGGPAIDWMRREAAKHDSAIAGSLIYSEKGKTFNRLYWMNPDGSYRFYDKRHLFRMSNEHKYYSRGSEKIIIEFMGWKICPLICYDLRFPVWSRNTEGYDLLIYVANWPASRSYAWNTLLRARAIENQCYVAGVNRVGTDGCGISYSGESMITDPKGIPLTGSISDKEAVITATIEYDPLEKYRKEFPVSEDSDKFLITD